MKKFFLLSVLLIISMIKIFSLSTTVVAQQISNPLPSWNNNQAKQNIISFVEKVTDKNSPNYVAPSERIAVFDNDGTLWSEQPLYFQAFFILDRLKTMAGDHPEWREKMPYKAILTGNQQEINQFSIQDLSKLIAVTHADITTEEFNKIASDWLNTAKHSRFHRLYKECVYQPMLELLDYLKTKDFKTYIVSGGGIEFIRAFALEVYGIPPEQVIGSSIKTRFEIRDGEAVLIKLPELNSVDDKEGKPININLHIGRRPIIAVGNSDGDREMLQYTASNQPSLMILLHHDDAEREWAYDRQSKIGKLDKAWDEGIQRGWTIVSMKKDFRKIYPFD